MPKIAKATTVRRAPKRTSAEKLIREHQIAVRTERRLKKKLDQLCKKYPDLVHRRPLLHVHTNPDGRQFFIRWINEYDRLFPPHHPKASGREQFLKAAEAALPEHEKKRKEVGLQEAERLQLDALYARWRAFEKLCRHTPRTLREAGLIVSYVLKVLPIEAEGKIFGRMEPGTFAEWKTRRDAVFYSVEKLLRAFAKAA